MRATGRRLGANEIVLTPAGSRRLEHEPRVGSGEGDPAAGEISYDAPAGSALLGRRVGDMVEVETPGATVRLEMVEVDG